MTSSHDVGDERICSTSTRGLSVSEFTEISPKQNVDDYYEESTPSDNGVEESLFGADWYRLCGNLVQHSQQQKQAIESPPPSPVYDPDDSVAERTEQSSSANIWVPVSLPDHIQHNLQCVCLSDELLWVVDSTGSVYCVIMEPPLSRDQPWKNIKGYLHQISSSSSGNNVWGVHDHNTYVRLGIGLYPEGTQWKNVTSNTHYANRIRQIAVDESAVWAVSTDGKVLFRSDVGQAYPEGKTWQEVRNDSESPQITFKFVACCHNVVWAVTTSGQVLCRTGIAYHMPSGRQWKEVKVPKLVSISITSEGVVWGVSENNVIGFRCGASTSKPRGKGPWWEVCIDALGTAPVLSHTIIDRLMDNLPFMEENHFISISASSKSGVVVLDEKGRHLHACWTTVIGFYYTPASSNDLFQSMGWSKIAAGGTALWLTTTIDGDLYSLASEDMTHIECPVKIDQIAASASCMWVMSEDSIWSRQMLSMKVPEGIAFDRIELSAELQCAQLRHIACGKNSAWAVDSNGVPHFQFTIQPQEPGAMSPAWIPLEDNPHPLKMITVSPNDCLVWACDEHHNVYARIGITPNSPVGQKWELIPGEQAKEICAENAKIYALTQNSELICRHGITENNVQGYYWRKMPGRFEHITVGETGDLCTVDTSGKVWKQEQMVVTVASPLVAEPRELEMTFSGEMSTSVTSDQSDWEVV